MLFVVIQILVIIEQQLANLQLHTNPISLKIIKHIESTNCSKRITQNKLMSTISGIKLVKVFTNGCQYLKGSNN